jgi:coenzyme F420-reducing hydrogenase delta subunit/ferredoxin
MIESFEPRIVGFLCNWCSYAGADLAGTSRLSYPPNIRIVRVPCSGRVDPLFVLRALRDGADGVLVLGCHPGDCHYSDGNYHARRRFAVMHELLSFVGYEPERVRVDWVSASEGARFARVVGEFTETVRGLGPQGRFAGAPPVGAQAAPLRPGSARAGEAPGSEQTQQLRELASRLLAEKQVDVVLGWEKGSVRERPLFATTAEQAARLVVPQDPGAALNLATYLHQAKGKKAAVVVRPGDARTINVLIKEGQLLRKDVVLIGAYDAVLGEAAVVTEASPPTPFLDEMEGWPVAQRAAFWNAQFDKCLRCYACRQACPLCYCAECMSEQLNPAWQSIAIEGPEQAFFHVMRAFHLAGRCTGCNACSNACPEGIPLYLLNQKVAREMARFFGPDGAKGTGYRAGLSADAALPFTVFTKDELAGGHA